MHKSFGGVHALRGAALEIRRSEIHGLVGENGSGKSTLLRILSGQLRPDVGRIELDGHARSFHNPAAALRSGIVAVTQETTLAPDLSVAENIFLGHRMSRRFTGIDWRSTQRRARAVLERLELDLNPRVVVRRLRPDQQQMVEIARAISMDARVLILDEPTSSLTDDEVEALFRVVRRLKESGVATIFVSHRLNEIFALTDWVTVLRDGVTVGSNATAAHDKGSLIQLMVGRAHEELEAPASAGRREPVLCVRGLSLAGHLRNVSLEVAPGEIVGLAGLVGAGRSELLEALFGLHPLTEGEIELAGRLLRCGSPRRAIREGLAFVPADRKRHGLILTMTVRENLVMAHTARKLRTSLLSAAQEMPVVTRAMTNLRIRAPSARAGVSTLSGGNQQKVVLAKWLVTRPLLLMLDEPTRGVDVGAKVEIYRLLRESAESGIGILVSSSETPELLTICDRILVMFRGSVARELSREEATEAAIAHYATGHE